MKKRFFSALLALLLFSTLIMSSIPALAANTITVSVKPAEHWTDVYLYVWDDSQSALAQWPGLPMTKGTDGWWTLEIPTGYTNVIANNSYATGEQTVDLKMDGNNDCWLVVIEQPDVHDQGIVYTDAACTKPFGGSTPSIPDDTIDLNDLHSLALVGTGIPGIRDWDPADPAGDMTKVSDGVYSKVISLTAGTTITFKIAGNDQWNEFFNYGGAEPMSMYPGDTAELISDINSRDINLTATKTGNLKFTIDLNGELPSLLVEETSEETDIPTPPAQDFETYTIYARVPSDWTDPRVWCWDNATSSPPNQGAWPGNLIMTQNENGWYFVEIPVGYNYLLVNANGGSVQTLDMTIQPCDEVWIDLYYGPYNAFVTYEPPIPANCNHPKHTSDGRCSVCGFKVGHRYNTDYCCTCGSVASDLKAVYFKNTTNYTEVYVYWCNTNANDSTNAPGVKMTAVADNIYSCWVPTNATYLIFNNGSDKVDKTMFASMTSELIVFDPATSNWISYQAALGSGNTELPSLGGSSETVTQPTKQEVEKDNNSTNPSDNNAVLVVIIIGAVVLMAAATVVIILIIKKKKK
jgi:hypothetical protein